MSVGGIDLSEHQNNEAVSNVFDKTSGQDQTQNKLVSVSGTYVMEVSTFCFRNKKRNNELVISPTLARSSKGGVNLVASMKVSEGFATDQVAAGDYITVNIPVWPGPKATEDDVSNMFRLSKPRMCALLGVDNFKIDLGVLVDKFSTQWDEQSDGTFKLTSDHSLKSKVVCVFDDDVYNDRPTLKLVNMRKYKDGDKSVSNGPATQAAQEGFGTESRPADENQGELDFAAAGDSASTPDTTGEAPSTVQEDNLPF